ncbi:MAG: glutamine--fructose-6-phosphate transaminase (isomerizing) [Candidatus Altiarchaeota archaeon]|nr:glutamine--fructose-6-phosphate transaminase (isomerizing) [Candidatus Altiarchaeota archaeon]
MCGISGYVGNGNAPEILFDMLKKLEYRGYDSAGIAYITGDGTIHLPKDKGKVDEVRRKLRPERLKSTIGVGHTRWATHGAPSQVNAHPHADCSGEIVVAHNGIIENYVDLKSELSELGHKFKSETDTEVIAHLVEHYMASEKSVLSALEKTLERLKGSFAITVITSREPDKIFIARNESPMLVGLGVGENFIASDAPAFLSKTKKALILEDMDYGFVSKKTVVIKNLSTRKEVKKKVHKITWGASEAEKEGFQHFMLKEIHEEPNAARNALSAEKELEEIAGKLAKKTRICFVACGTAYHAGLVGKYILENYGIPAEAFVASEFRYSTVETMDDKTGVVSITQSGETADTIAAIKGAKKKDAYIASIVNVVGSSVTRISDDVAYIRAGPEIAVASTKAYIGQVLSCTLLSLLVARAKGRISAHEFEHLKSELKNIPRKIKEAVENRRINEIAEENASTKKFFFIGRNINYPTALEGALKLKEISYVHAEGYPAGELKHGPIAILDQDTTVLAITAEGKLRDKMHSNIQEAKARGAKVITVGFECDLDVPKTDPLLSPILNIVPLHMLAYYISVLKGLDPDKPRNLAKSVTVE